MVFNHMYLSLVKLCRVLLLCVQCFIYKSLIFALPYLIFKFFMEHKVTLASRKNSKIDPAAFRWM